MKSQIKVKRREILSCQKHTREIKYQFRDVVIDGYREQCYSMKGRKDLPTCSFQTLLQNKEEFDYIKFPAQWLNWKWTFL